MYGNYWAENGAKENKENAVQDLQAVLKFIVNKHYTTADQITLMGGSYNGYLIGEAIARFPELFRAAVIVNGLFDLIHHHVYNPPIYANLYTIAAAQQAAKEKSKKPTLESSNISTNKREPITLSTKTINTNELWKYSIWTQEFGCVLESEQELLRLLDISPLHNLQKLAVTSSASSEAQSSAINTNQRFPAVLLLSGKHKSVPSFSGDNVFFIDLLMNVDHLNIVSCKHSLKFLAQLQKVVGKLSLAEVSKEMK